MIEIWRTAAEVLRGPTTALEIVKPKTSEGFPFLATSEGFPFLATSIIGARNVCHHIC